MSNQTETQRPVVLLRIKEVIGRTKLSRSTIYGKLDSKSNQYDYDFPVPLKIGASSTAWIEAEIDAWLQVQIDKRDHLSKQGHKPTTAKTDRVH